jgi:hypothetical protein
MFRSKDDLFIDARSRGSEFIEEFIEVAVSDPLNDIEINTNQRLDLVLADLKLLSFAVLLNAYNNASNAFDEDEEYEEAENEDEELDDE